MAITKRKGDLGVAMVMSDAMKKGHKVAIPVGEDWPFDLIVQRNGVLERVQCKYTESNGAFVEVKCRSTNGFLDYRYTDKDIDWLAVYDKTTDRCYYLPASLLGEGKTELRLRLKPTKKGNYRMAEEFTTF